MLPLLRGEVVKSVFFVVSRPCEISDTFDGGFENSVEFFVDLENKYQRRVLNCDVC